MSPDIPLSWLFGVLVVLLCMSAFFSSSETALMSLNRYRLRHRARAGHKPSRITEKLLSRPDRLIGLILLGNNLVNIMAASLTTIICLRIGGEPAIAVGTGILTLVVLIFAEVAPKTMAALHPEKIAFPAAYVYYPLLKVLYPFVWTVNLVANGILRLFGVRAENATGDALSREELRTVVNEAGAMISHRYRRMLLGILDLEKVTVDDVMISRNNVVGIDLENDIDEIIKTIQESVHTRLPVYRDSIDNVIGILHLRRVVNALRENTLTRDKLVELLAETYFVPEGTPLSHQLVEFQQHKRRIAMIVDEYGDLQGMVTLEDILEEIVGEFTTDPLAVDEEIIALGKDQFQLAGTAGVRELNRVSGWRLSTEGPRTINGLIVETLESIPAAGTRFLLDQYVVNVLDTAENRVEQVRIHKATADERDALERAQIGTSGERAD